VVAAILAVALPAGYFLARQYAWPAYKEWRVERLARMTRDFMASGDYDNALLTARQALRDNQRSLPLWELAAAAAKAKNKPDAIYYQMNVARLAKSLPSRLELIRLALQYSDYRDALDAIESVDEAGRRSAEFHRLAAQTYEAVGRPVPAKLHLFSLLSLEPDNQPARLDMAEIELAEDTTRSNRQVRDDLRQLSTVPALRVRALSLLLRDALAGQDAAAARNFADQLATSPELTGVQQVLVLAGLDKGAPERAAQYRRELQERFAPDPASAVALVDYYRQYGPSAEARQWFESLPASTRADPAVQEAIAAAYLEWQEWPRLDQALAAAAWKDREFMRNAFMAYSARKNGRLADAGNFWRLAVIQAGDSVRNTSELLSLVARWGWQNEQYDLVWKLFALMPRNDSISGQLLAWERSQGHTANLNRIFARLLEFAGDDRMLRNNYAYSSLLLDANLSKAAELAEANYQAEPDNPYYVTTYAFALYKQGHADQALAVLDKLRPSALSTPERTLFRALYRATTGDANGAADLLSGLKTANFLPEERRLATRATEQIARVQGDSGQDQKLLALSSRGAIDRSKGWLQFLPENARATPEMQVTDALFAMGDMAGLGAQLRKGTWGDSEHLRFALTAAVARNRGDSASARSYWRSALGAAAGDPDKLRQLEALARGWNWPAERMDVLARIYDIDPSNRAAFTELMNYYRSAGRTAEMVGVLNSYLSAHPADQAQRTGYAYYSMLSGLNVSRAYITAQETFEADPNEAERRLVYAFALWKQRRPQEAWQLLESVQNAKADLVPAPLIRAAILADMDRAADAAKDLERFDRKTALPEEASLATVVASRIREDKRVSGLN
jgi:hypothetical protein